MFDLFEVAEGSLRVFKSHKNQQAFSRCFTASLQLAQTRTQLCHHKSGKTLEAYLFLAAHEAESKEPRLFVISKPFYHEPG